MTVGAVRTNVETRLTVYIVGLTALGGLFGRQLRMHSPWGALCYGTLFALVFVAFVATLVGFPRERADPSA